MKTRAVKFIAIFAAFCVAFSGLPFFAGDLDVHAASKKKVAKNITLTATSSGKTVTLKWNKIKSPNNGYAVFRDGKPVKHLGKKAVNFTDKDIEDGNHIYQIKTYKTKKVKMWYNKKTGQYQKKKPAKKYCGKAKKVATYTYKKKSNSVAIKIEASEYTITWKNWDGKVLGTSSVKAGVTPVYGGTPTRAADDNYTYAFSGWSPSVVVVNGDAVYTAQFKATAKATTPSNEPSTEPTSQYSYDIKFINEPYGNGGETTIYIKTDNPDVWSYGLSITDSKGNKVKGSSIVSDYDDYSDDEHVSVICLDNAGLLTFSIEEVEVVGAERIRTKVYSKTVNVRDYAAEEEAWYQSVINEATDSSMTNKEKMQAICGYILGHYKYTKTDGNRYITLLADEGIPYWKGRLNSSSSPSILVNFGEYLGYPLENLYAKYPSNTPEWKQYHMYAYSAEDDWYFQACPATDTGLMSRSDIVPFDPETYEFWED